MKKFPLFFMMLFVVGLQAQTTISKKIKDFTTIKVYNGIDVELIKSDLQELVITGEKSEKVNVKHNRNILKISLKFPETLANNKVKVKLYYNKKIQVIDANEGASIVAKEIKQQQLEVKTQEGAYVNLLVDVKHLTIKAVSGGVIKLTGTAKNQSIEVNNAGVYHGFNLKTTDTSIVKAALGGKAEVAVGETLDAMA